MKHSNVELPSNRSFGFLFGFIFLVVSAYFYMENSAFSTYFFFMLSIFFSIVALVKADVLQPLNNLWMQFGLLLGMIVSPIVLGIIFFGLFTPLSVLMRLFGRDELRLRYKKKPTYWILRESPIGQADAFKQQF